jgi:hypothetical protein
VMNNKKLSQFPFKGFLSHDKFYARKWARYKPDGLMFIAFYWWIDKSRGGHWRVKFFWGHTKNFWKDKNRLNLIFTTPTTKHLPFNFSHPFQSLDIISSHQNSISHNFTSRLSARATSKTSQTLFRSNLITSCE